jgi:excisionase family DNA binding protein
LPIVDVSRRLNCSVSHVYRLVESGALPAIRIGPRALRVDEHDLAQYLVEHDDDGAA